MGRWRVLVVPRDGRGQRETFSDEERARERYSIVERDARAGELRFVGLYRNAGWRAGWVQVAGYAPPMLWPVSR